MPLGIGCGSALLCQLQAGAAAGCHGRPSPGGSGNSHAAQLKGAAAHLPSAHAYRCDALAPSPIATRTGVQPAGPDAGFGVLAGFSSAPARSIRGRGPGAGAAVRVGEPGGAGVCDADEVLHIHNTAPAVTRGPGATGGPGRGYRCFVGEAGARKTPGMPPLVGAPRKATLGWSPQEGARATAFGAPRQEGARATALGAPRQEGARATALGAPRQEGARATALGAPRQEGARKAPWAPCQEGRLGTYFKVQL